ncbi:MAG TPA: hypothetical protein VH950_17630 [Gaiellaceae bacterium]
MEASSGGPNPTETPAQRGRSLRTAATITAVVGALHAILFLLAWWLLSDAPGADAPDAEIVEYYGSASSRRTLLVGLYLMPFAGMAFVWFIVALRMWEEGTTHRRSVLQSNLQLISGIVYVALFFVGAAASSVVAGSVQFADGETDPEFARQFPVFGTTVIFVFAFRMASMFVFTTSALLLRAGVLPRWFAWSGYAVATFLLLSASFVQWFVIVFPIWLLVLSALLLRTARHIDPELRLPPARRLPLLARQPEARAPEH